MQTASCSACGAPIRWATTTKGRRMPIDPDPHPQGNIILEHLGEGVAPIAHVNAGPIEGGYRSHFVTCPNADDFRRKR